MAYTTWDFSIKNVLHVTTCKIFLKVFYLTRNHVMFSTSAQMCMEKAVFLSQWDAVIKCLGIYITRSRECKCIDIAKQSFYRALQPMLSLVRSENRHTVADTSCKITYSDACVIVRTRSLPIEQDRLLTHWILSPIAFLWNCLKLITLTL